MDDRQRNYEIAQWTDLLERIDELIETILSLRPRK